jgi:glucose/arabinose dehydrogenase
MSNAYSLPLASNVSLVSAKLTDDGPLSRTFEAPPAPAACPGVPAASFPFQVASGWTVTKVAGGLKLPRSIVVDSQGRLLLVQNGIGVTQHTLTSDGCIQSSTVLIAQTNLNHGMYLSPNSSTLYASSLTTVWSWSYDPISGNISGSPTVLVTRMANSGHSTRTLIIPPHAPNLLLVSHGSDGNIDVAAANPATARAVVKVFDLTELPSGGYNYITQGYLMGYGLRNEVALAFDGNNMFGFMFRVYV